MVRTALDISFATVFVAVAALLLASGVRAHDQYGRAHVAADEALRSGALPTTLPVSPESFFRKAQQSTLGAVGTTAIALLVALKTRRLLWFACFMGCAAVVLIAVTQTAIGY